MTRARVVGLSVGVVLVLLVVWIARNSYWADVTMPLPPKGEALTNPFYAAQRFTEALGAHTVHDRQLGAPAPDAVIVLSAWNWSLSHARRQALKHWVESGGRLVVDRTVLDSEDDFERWSGIVESERERAASASTPHAEGEGCVPLREEHRGAAPASSGRPGYDVCSVDEAWSLESRRNVTWALRGASGIQAMRVPVGRGSVTMINANPFRYRYLLDGDHARLLVAATQLHRADDVHFLSEDNAPWLLTLAWLRGAPVIAILAVVVALALWRSMIRFGPLAAPDTTARRSLAEQIRGTGRFALLHGSGESLHAACVRALEEAVRRRVKTYSSLGADERADAVASITGFNRKALAAAIQPHGAANRSNELRRTITFLETARRQILKRDTHGTSRNG